MVKKNSLGFTLIELLIVIAIIGVLAVAFLPSLLNAPAKGRDAQRVADLQKIQKVLISGNLVGKAYPATGCVAAALNLDATEFGGALPTDPQTGNKVVVRSIGAGCTGQYAYVKSPENKYSFGLYAKMETQEAGNVNCDKIAASDVDLSEKPPGNDKSCYAILLK